MMPSKWLAGTIWHRIGQNFVRLLRPVCVEPIPLDFFFYMDPQPMVEVYLLC